MADNNVKIGIEVDVEKASADLKRFQDRVQSSGSNAVANFNQVLRDTPSFANGFNQGIMAISNNIGPLVDSLRVATKEAGSIGGALSSIASSFIGPMGLITLISIGTSVLTAYGDEIVKAMSDTFGFAKSTAELNKEIDASNKLYEINTKRLQDLTSQQFDLDAQLAQLTGKNRYGFDLQKLEQNYKDAIAFRTEYDTKTLDKNYISDKDEKDRAIKWLEDKRTEYNNAEKVVDAYEKKKQILQIESSKFDEEQSKKAADDYKKRKDEQLSKDKAIADEQLRLISASFDIKRNKLLEQYNQGKIDEFTYRQELVKIQSDETQASNSFIDDNFKRLQLTNSQKIQEQQNNIEKEQNLIKSFNDWQLKQQEDADKKKKEAEKKAIDDLKKLRSDEYQNSIKDANDFWDKQKATIEKQAYDEKWSKEQLAAELAKIQKNRDEQLLTIQNDYGEKTGAIEAKIAQDSIDLDTKTWEAKAANLMKYIDYARQGLDILSGFNDVLKVIDENRINDINTKLDEQLTANDNANKQELSLQQQKIDQQLANENLSEEEKSRIKKQGENERAQIEYNHELKRYELQKAAVEARNKIAEKEFKIQKALNLANAIVDGAAMVIKSISASGGVPAGIPAGIAAGVIATANIAKILATKFKPESAPTPPQLTLPNNIPLGGGSDGTGTTATNMNLGLQRLIGTTLMSQRRVYVTQTDIKNVNDKVEVVQNAVKIK